MFIVEVDVAPHAAKKKAVRPDQIDTCPVCGRLYYSHLEGTTGPTRAYCGGDGDENDSDCLEVARAWRVLQRLLPRVMKKATLPRYFAWKKDFLGLWMVRAWNKGLKMGKGATGAGSSEVQAAARERAEAASIEADKKRFAALQAMRREETRATQ